MRVPPLLNDYVASLGGSVAGAYMVGQKSGNTVSLAAPTLATGAGAIYRIRWAPSGGPANFLFLIRLKASWSVQAAVTAATIMDLQAWIARAFTVDYSANNTFANMIATTNSNVMYESQQGGNSLMGTAGPGICTTAAMTGQTLTGDTNAFAVAAFANQPSGNATVTQAVGVGHPPVTMYEWTGLGQIPIILSKNEGILIAPMTAGVVTGAINYYIQAEWAEVIIA